MSNNIIIVAPTIIGVEPGQEAYETEIFGPVLCVIRRDSLDDVLKLIHSNRCAFYYILQTHFSDGIGTAIVSLRQSTYGFNLRGLRISYLP
jgi:acyl-CoA reductase-like NAD-dependent aldehyde dehydrogenase